MFQEAMTMIVSRWGDLFGGLLVQHIQISAIAIVYATILGLLMGIMISERPKSSKGTLAVVNLLYTIPSLALLGLLIPFTGVGDVTAIIALTVYGLLPMVKNTNTGIKNVDPAVIEAARGMGSTNKQILFRIKLPLAFPVIITGFRNMVTMTISLTTIASFIGAGGLGVAIFRGITTNNMPMVLAGSIIVAALAIAVDLILGAIEKRLYSKGRHHQKRRVLIGLAIVFAAILGVGVYNAVEANIQNDNTVKVVDKNFTEQMIMGQILSQYIEYDTNLNVDLTEGVSGGAPVIQPALLKGDYDMYPEYTGVAWNQILQRTDVYDEGKFDELQSAYNDMGLQWEGIYGFEDTYSIAVTQEVADKYNLHTYNDLVKSAGNLSLGAEPNFFNRPDGYDALSSYYGFKFGSTLDIDVGLKYKAIAAGDVNAIIIYTTDGQLQGSGLVVLTDDRKFFPSYYAGTVIRQETLQKHPELKATLDRLDGTMDEATMTRLNYEVDIEGKDSATVAHEFLVSSGLVKEG